MAASSLAQFSCGLIVCASSLALVSGAVALAGEGNGPGSGERYRLKIGDTIGVYVGGVLGDPKAAIPVAAPRDKTEPARTGYPLRVREDGSVSVPWIAAVNVEGKTIAETQALIDGAFERLYEQPSKRPAERPEVAVTLMRKRPADEPKVYRVRPGDVLGIFIGGIVGDMDGQPPVHLEYRPNLLPSMGFPVPVELDGSIHLPFVSPIDVANRTLVEVESEIHDAYLVDQEILKPDGLHRIVVSPMWITEREINSSEPPRLQAGDTLALLFLDHDGLPTFPWRCKDLGHTLIYTPDDGQIPPFWGFPFPVLQDGTVHLPLIPPVDVQGKTLTEAWRLISDAAHTERTILQRPYPLILTTISEHQIARRGILANNKIGSGDLLCIAGLPGERVASPDYCFPDDPELAPCFGEFFPVFPDGTLLLPTIGRLQAAGRSTSELQDMIVARYVEHEMLEEWDYVIVRIARRAG